MKKASLSFFKEGKEEGKKTREGRGRKEERGMGEREETVNPNISNTKISVAK